MQKFLNGKDITNIYELPNNFAFRNATCWLELTKEDEATPTPEYAGMPPDLYR